MQNLTQISLDSNTQYFQSENQDSTIDLCPKKRLYPYMCDDVNGTLSMISDRQIVPEIQQQMMDRLGNICEQMSEAKSQIINIVSQQSKTADKIDQVLLCSQKKGAHSEQLVEEMLQQWFPDAIVVNTSQETAEGDIHMIWGTQPSESRFKLLIELKNYSSTVPNIEVEKFHRDVDSSDCDAGLFLSFGQKIAMKNRVMIGKTNKNKHVSYLSQLNLINVDIIVNTILLMKHNHFQYLTSDQDNKLQLTTQIGHINKLIEEKKKQAKAYKKQLEKQLIQLNQYLNSLDAFKFNLDSSL